MTNTFFTIIQFAFTVPNIGLLTLVSLFAPSFLKRMQRSRCQTVLKLCGNEITYNYCISIVVVMICSAQIFAGVGFPHPVPEFLEDLAKPSREEAIHFLGKLCSCLALLVTAIQR